MDYMTQIEEILNDLDAKKIDTKSAGIEVESIVSEAACLSLGELEAVESELNSRGASMYEDVFNEIEESKMKKFIVRMEFIETYTSYSDVEIEANSIEDAKNKAVNDYESGDFSPLEFDSGAHIDTEIDIGDIDNWNVEVSK